MADPVELSPPVLSGTRIGPVEVPPARPAVTSETLRAEGTADRLQFTRQTRVPFLQKYFQENTAGAPLDITTGLSSYDRFQLGLHRTEDDQRRYLEGKYGEGSTRKATDGQWIVRAQGASGPVDLVADPLGVDAGDWAELGSSAPEIVGSFLGMGAGRILPWLGKVKGFVGGARDVVTGAAGAQAAGAIKDIASRVSEGAPADIPEVVRERAVSGALDTLIGGTIGTGLGVARFLKNPWIRNRTDIQLNALRAQTEIADKYGIHIALTPAEETGSHMLGIEQARLEQVPGAAGVLRKFRAEQQTGPMSILREVMLGGRVPDSDVVGRQAISALQRTTGATDATVDAARINLSKAALQEMEQSAATQSLADRGLEHGFVGDAIRNRITALRDEVKAFSNGLFEKVRSLGGDQPIFDGTGLANEAANLRKTLPPSFVGVTPKTSITPAVSSSTASVSLSGKRLQQAFKERLEGMNPQAQTDAFGELGFEVDEAGRVFSVDRGTGRPDYWKGDALTDAKREFLELTKPKGVAVPSSVSQASPPPLPSRTVTGAPTSVEFVPANIRGMLDELEAGKGHLYRLSDLQQMRRRVYDDIGKGNALPGYDTHYLGKIGEALTKAIDDGVAKLPTGDLRSALTAANTHYKERLLPFNRRGITEMFVKDDEVGYIGSSVLGSQYTSGPAAADKWRVLKEFIGSDSVEGRTVKRMAFDHVIGGAVEPGGQLLNASEVLRRLKSFSESSPDLYKEMFGKAADDLQRVARFAIAGEKDMLPTHEIEAMMRSGKGPTVTALRALKEAEAKQSELYRNRVLEGVKSGKWDASKINADEFVNRFADNASAKEITETLALISKTHPALAQDIRSSALEKFLNRNSETADIGEALLKAERSKPMRALLGEDLFADLHRYGALQKAIVTTREASIAGAFEKTTTMNLLLKLPFRFLEKVVGNKIVAHALTSDTLRSWALRQPEKSEAVTILLLSSPEFLRGVSRSFGNDTEGIRRSEAYLGQARRALNESWSQSQGAQSRQPAQTNAPSRLSPPTLMLR